MNPRVVSVTPDDDFTLVLGFANGETRVFDCKPYLHEGVFRELADIGYFRRVTVMFGSVAWPHEQDFCPDTLYLESVAMPKSGSDTKAG